MECCSYEHIEGWSNDLNTGIENIDEQHKKLFVLLQSCRVLVQQSQVDGNELGAALSELKRFAFEHFATEEKYMESINYQDINRHKLEHNVFRSKLRLFLRRSNRCDNIFVNDLIAYTKIWLLNHIPSVDKKFVKNTREV